MNHRQQLNQLRAAVCSEGAPSARNLLVTIFGDTLLPYQIDSGEKMAVSVQTLTALMEPFGANQRLVRTSLSRLVSDEILDTTSQGRRSFYGVATPAEVTFAEAEQRIYHPVVRPWDGQFQMVVLDDQFDLRPDLAAAGFGPLSPQVFVAPFASVPASARSAITATVRFDDPVEVTRRALDLEYFVARYEELSTTAALVDEGLAAELEPADAFKLRTLLIAEFRRVVLDAPRLPPELLPDDWIGDRVRAQVKSIYRACSDAAERYALDHVEHLGGPLGSKLDHRSRFDPK